MEAKVYTSEELEERKRFITKVLETGTPEEVARLREAELDPELHSQIKKLIEDVRFDMGMADLGGEHAFDTKAKPEGIVDLEVARLAKELGGKDAIGIFTTFDEIVNETKREMEDEGNQ